jgi:anti-anti-sigma factor
MHDQPTWPAPVTVRLPAEIDVTNQERAYDQLCAAVASGAPVIIADFTATSFCDCSSLRRLVAIQRHAAVTDAELLVVNPPSGVVHRLATLLGLDPIPFT